jgi:hypothetical protein
MHGLRPLATFAVLGELCGTLQALRESRNSLAQSSPRTAKLAKVH